MKVGYHIIPQVIQFKMYWIRNTKRLRNKMGCKPSNSSWVDEMKEENSKVLCDTMVPLKLKEIFYRAVVKPTMLYETKY